MKSELPPRAPADREMRGQCQVWSEGAKGTEEGGGRAEGRAPPCHTHSLTHTLDPFSFSLALEIDGRAAPRRGPTAKFRRAKNRDLRTLNERTNERTKA